MKINNNTESPCLACTRVRDPKNCENKLCREWQAWFIDRWEAMRTSIMHADCGNSIHADTVSVGGTKYYHPDQVRRSMETNPCLRCIRSKGLCAGPCQVKRTWNEEKEKMCELENRSQGETAQV